MIHSLVHWGSKPHVPASPSDYDGFVEGDLMCVDDKLLPIYEVTSIQRGAASENYHVTLTKLCPPSSAPLSAQLAPDRYDFDLEDPERWVLHAHGGSD